MQEVWLVEPDAQRVTIIESRSGAAAETSAVLGLSVEQLRAVIGWH